MKYLCPAVTGMPNRSVYISVRSMSPQSVVLNVPVMTVLPHALVTVGLLVAAILTTRRLSGYSGSLKPEMRSLPGVIQMSSKAT